MKPRVYVETSVVSYLTARPSRDHNAAARRESTLEWWQEHAPNYALLISEFVTTEAAAGHPQAAARRLAVLEQLPILTTTAAVGELANNLLRVGALPGVAQLDALHISVAAVNGIEYLLTWNCKHIANARMRPKIEACCIDAGLAPPVICTPDELR